jgi:hypothetical protein
MRASGHFRYISVRLSLIFFSMRAASSALPQSFRATALRNAMILPFTQHHQSVRRLSHECGSLRRLASKQRLSLPNRELEDHRMTALDPLGRDCSCSSRSRREFLELRSHVHCSAGKFVGNSWFSSFVGDPGDSSPSHQLKLQGVPTFGRKRTNARKLRRKCPKERKMNTAKTFKNFVEKIASYDFSKRRRIQKI